MEKTPKTPERENPSLRTITSNSNGIENPSTQSAVSISETNGCPTTFIQADSNSFKQVVQMFTGSQESPTKHASKTVIPIKTGSKKQGFKLHERRNSFRSHPKVIPELALNSVISPSQLNILSPSVLDLHKLVLSPIPPLISESFIETPSTSSNFSSLQEKVIADKGSEPQLLPLFPVTSPRVSGTY